MMEKAFDFLSSHKDVAFATVEQDKPKIRVFQIMKQEGHTLYFATSQRKEVYRQLQENPNIELLAMDGNISVRVTGRAMFDVSDEVAREIYDTNPVLQRLYRQYTDMVYFRMAVDRLDYYDLAPTPPILEHYEYNLPARYVLHTVGPTVHDGKPTPKQECEDNTLLLELSQCTRQND